jgi:hypothetical protein
MAVGFSDQPLTLKQPSDNTNENSHEEQYAEDSSDYSFSRVYRTNSCAKEAAGDGACDPVCSHLLPPIVLGQPRRAASAARSWL